MPKKGKGKKDVLKGKMKNQPIRKGRKKSKKKRKKKEK